MWKAKPWHWALLAAIAIVWAVFGLWWLLAVWLMLWLASLAFTFARQRRRVG